MPVAQNLTEDKDRPTVQLDKYLTGDLAAGKVSEAVLSAATLPIYKIAVKIARLPTLERRRLAFAEVPEHLSERVGGEVERIWKDEKKGQ